MQIRHNNFRIWLQINSLFRDTRIFPFVVSKVSALRSHGVTKIRQLFETTFIFCPLVGD